MSARPRARSLSLIVLVSARLDVRGTHRRDESASAASSRSAPLLIRRLTIDTHNGDGPNRDVRCRRFSFLPRARRIIPLDERGGDNFS